MVTLTLGWLAAALSVLLLWPQVWLSCVKGRTGGMSPTGTWLGAAIPAGWICYGLLLGDPVQIVTNTVTGAAGVALLAAVLVTRPQLRARRAVLPGILSAAAVLACAAAAATADLAGARATTTAGFLGTVLAVAGAAANVPQPLALLRDRRQCTAGLSASRWWMTAAASGLWVAYGAGAGQPAVWAGAAWGLITSLTVCVLLTASRRTASRAVRYAGVRWPHLDDTRELVAIPA
jgi:uncharacterized protein with PQ loop repeat